MNGAIEQNVRKQRLFLRGFQLGAGKIERPHDVCGIDRGADRTRGVEAVTVCARKRVRMHDRLIRHEFLVQRGTGAEPAGRQNYAAPHPNGLALVADVDDGAFDALLAFHQRDQACVECDRHIARTQAVEQAADQRVTHHETRAAGKTQAVGRVP